MLTSISLTGKQHELRRDLFEHLDILPDVILQCYLIQQQVYDSIADMVFSMEMWDL